MLEVNGGFKTAYDGSRETLNPREALLPVIKLESAMAASIAKDSHKRMLVSSELHG